MFTSRTYLPIHRPIFSLHRISAKVNGSYGAVVLTVCHSSKATTAVGLRLADLPRLQYCG